MRVRFWGTRGSITSDLGSDIRSKLAYALTQAHGKDLSSPERIEQFIASLPSHILHPYGAHTLCVQIEARARDFIFCDAGTGIAAFARTFKRSNLPQTGNTFHIFLSHLHWDHIQGFPFFILPLHKGNRFIIHGYHDKTEDVFHQMMSSPVFPVPLKSLPCDITFNIQKPETPFFVADTHITSLLQNHPGLSYAYKFSRSHQSIVYSTDCEHTKGARNAQHPFVRFYQGADLLMFDAMSSLAEEAQVGWGHSTYKIGLELAAWAKVKTLAFLHHDPDMDDTTLQTLLPLTTDYQTSHYQTHATELGTPSYPLSTVLAYDGLELTL